MKMASFFLFLFCISLFCGLKAQELDSITPHSTAIKMTETSPRWNKASKIGLTVTGTSLGIGYGVLGLFPSAPKEWNLQVREHVTTQFPGFRTHVDDYLQFAPGIAGLALKLSGVKGKYPVVPSLTTFALGGIFMIGTVNGIKYTAKEPRPDTQARNSFPSGHTATTFAMAEWLRTEYWETSPWIGVGGYLVAGSVGTLRVFNNRHWVTDVVAGAAIGILTVRLAYWLKPYIIDPIFRKVAPSKGRIQWF